MAGKLAVFNLPEDCKDEEMNDMFEKYGRLTRACVRSTKSGGTMGFVEFADPRDAEDAKRDKHGYNFEGRRLRVEFSNPPGSSGGKKGKGRGRGDSRGRGRYDSRRRGGGGRYDSRRGRGKGRGRTPPRRGGPKEGGKGGVRDAYFKVRVVGIPPTASWQDVKDFLRKAGSVKFADLDPENKDCAIGGFDDKSDMDRAIEELDDQVFKARDGDTRRVKVEEFGSGGKRRPSSRSRSRSPEAQGSDKGRDDSRSRSRSRSR